MMAYAIDIADASARPRPDRTRASRSVRSSAVSLHQWFLQTRAFQRNVQRREGGTTGIDNDVAARSFENLGEPAACIPDFRNGCLQCEAGFVREPIHPRRADAGRR